MSNRQLPRSPYLNQRFAAAIDQFGADLRASANIHHPVGKGSEREHSLTDFFRRRLPERFGVVSGEVVDLHGETGPQLDILIYDRFADFPFNNGNYSIVAAEALLASIEIKSRLTSNEINKCVDAARRLRRLRPHGRELGGKNVAQSKNGAGSARYMHCIFAFGTDIGAKRWPTNEAARFNRIAGEAHMIDGAYVLGRGLINFNCKRARMEDEKAGAISSFYFTILNFVLREADRRKPTPYGRYVTHAPQSWTDI
ncbi:DUF6602 domain-containing protein [Inquilinus sp. Marseille-Q2685]|uniref:DUF6602 domain-containing protein n=1 Tax=Inquilinus sp. Marseille-Q2685 TaxID=2866581 RepID=UPI001CE43F61|nr:DUF6602 domain-containing protein [Inquilinus sp. Marseille-Q2685]